MNSNLNMKSFMAGLCYNYAVEFCHYYSIIHYWFQWAVSGTVRYEEWTVVVYGEYSQWECFSIGYAEEVCKLTHNHTNTPTFLFGKDNRAFGRGKSIFPVDFPYRWEKSSYKIFRQGRESLATLLILFKNIDKLKSNAVCFFLSIPSNHISSLHRNSELLDWYYYHTILACLCIVVTAPLSDRTWTIKLCSEISQKQNG